jgi:hypothetical protein
MPDVEQIPGGMLVTGSAAYGGDEVTPDSRLRALLITAVDKP